MAQQTINIGTSPNDGTGDPLRNSFNKANLNFTELYGGAGVVDDSITYAKLGTEFTTSAALATNVDFATAQVFTKTLSGNTTLTFSNDEIGMVKDLVITGDFTLTLPSGSTVAGTYNGTVSNLIQIVVTGAAQYWYSISQPKA
jgi:hypothetical protein